MVSTCKKDSKPRVTNAILIWLTVTEHILLRFRGNDVTYICLQDYIYVVHAECHVLVVYIVFNLMRKLYHNNNCMCKLHCYYAPFEMWRLSSFSFFFFYFLFSKWSAIIHLIFFWVELLTRDLIIGDAQIPTYLDQ